NTGSYPEYGQSIVPEGLGKVTAIAAGFSYTLALQEDGTVVAWGNLPFEQPTVTGIIVIAAGQNHAVALRSDGTIVEWGGGLRVPPGLTGVAIAAGSYHSVAIVGTGEIAPAL